GLGQLHPHGHHIQRPLAVDDYLPVVSDLGNSHQHRLHLAGEDVDSPDDEHIVRPAHDPHDARVGAAAVTDLIAHYGEVANSIANEGQGELVQGGEYQLALLPLSHRLTGIRVHHLGEEHVPPDVDAFLGMAFGEKRPGDLARPVDVIGIDPRVGLDSLPGFKRPGLRPEYSHLKLGVILDGDAHFL